MTSLNQFFSLDLAKSWNSNSPAWSQHKPGPQKAIFPGTFSADQKTMVVFHTSKPNSPFAAWRYSVDSDSWTPSKASFPFQDRNGLASVTDPNTGLVYTAGGYVNPIEGVAIDVYNFDEDSVSTIPIPDALDVFSTRVYYTSVWSQQRNSILYFGGYTLASQPVQPLNSVAEFVPASKGWRTMPTTGTAPPLRGCHCMAANEDGTRVIVYGGKLYAASNTTTGDIYILNTVTKAWTTGKAGSPRIYTTCTIAGDQFLVWGGATNDNAIPSSEVLIYSIKNDNWIASYTPPLSYLSPSSTSGGVARPSSMPDDSSSAGEKLRRVGGIIGGVIGGLIVVGAVLFLLCRRRRLHSRTVAGDLHRDDEPKAQHNKRQLQDNIGGGSDDDNNNVEAWRSQLQTQQERQDALQQQVELLQTQHQASTSSPPYDSLYTYQVPVVTYPPPQNPKIFDPSTSRTPQSPTTLVYDSEWTASSSSDPFPIVYDPMTAPVNMIRPKRNPEMSSQEDAGMVQEEGPRSGHTRTPFPPAEDVHCNALTMHTNNPHA
ncbi:hypothetical protein BGZ95_011816 [Linnemannia exigua]|uniref:Galactose oxidase n=1 Tax=Linnemannia exigua TaxID=604196 RepID=A0AAD4H5D0_9FUNG|nr:hypothetical protein BGZ95_011816 [Linnemannia exigua]